MDTAPDKAAGESGTSSPNLSEISALMTADRTLMSWISTTLSLQSFGFTIYKVLEAMREAGRDLPRDNTPQIAGLFLVAMGALAITMGIIEYWFTLKELNHTERFLRPRASLIMAALMAVLGAALLVTIGTRAF